MTQVLVINKHGKANLKEILLKEPELKSPKNLTNLKNIEHARDNHSKEYIAWKKTLNDYEVNGIQKRIRNHFF